MKKTLSGIITMILVLSALMCPAALASDVTGVWYGDMMGMIATLTINEDGTYGLDLMGDVMPGVWELEGDTLYMDRGTEVEAFFTYDAAAQILDMAGQVQFGREPIQPFDPGSPRADAALEEFAGSWTAVMADAFGALMPVDAAGFYMDAAIEGTSVTLTINFVGEEIRAGEGAFEAGVLTLLVPAESEYSEDETYAISLTDAGYLSVATELFTDSATFYLEKVG